MAKKTTTLRVHKIAKELGVSSKDIIAKCTAEEIPDITNHMSAVSLGLAATIKDWFSDSATSASSSVEKAEKVDVKTARAKAKRTAKPTTDVEGSDEPVASTATAVAEPPAPPFEPPFVPPFVPPA